MDARLLERFDFFQGQRLNRIPIVNELVRRIGFLCH